MAITLDVGELISIFADCDDRLQAIAGEQLLRLVECGDLGWEEARSFCLRVMPLKLLSDECRVIQLRIFHGLLHTTEFSDLILQLDVIRHVVLLLPVYGMDEPRTLVEVLKIIAMYMSLKDFEDHHLEAVVLSIEIILNNSLSFELLKEAWNLLHQHLVIENATVRAILKKIDVLNCIHQCDFALLLEDENDEPGVIAKVFEGKLTYRE